jgi:leader peptidase (prepilin peptidase)/N-methyltransferase
VTYLILVFIIDLEHRLILHPVSIFGAILFTILGLYLNGWQDTVLGGGLGFLLMYALYLFGILFTKWIAKRRGETIDEVALGFGDVNLTAILGLLFGWPRIAVLLFFAILFGGLFGIGYLLVLKAKNKYELFTPIPYAPFLIIAGLIILYISSPK